MKTSSAKAKGRKPKRERVDGLGPDELKRIHSAVRLVWTRCLSRRLAVKRASDAKGFVYCELCKEVTPKAYVDHIEPIGQVGGPDYIQRMFKPSIELQVLCRSCHDKKTRAERKGSA
jgi:hypothetical protein